MNEGNWNWRCPKTYGHDVFSLIYNMKQKDAILRPTAEQVEEKLYELINDLRKSKKSKVFIPNTD
jgi:hypothetical protein